MSKVALPADIYLLGPYTVNCHELSVSNENGTITLPVKVFELLKLFIQSENHSVQRSVAIDIIWDGNTGVGERGFTNAMWHLRKTFSDLGAESEGIFKTLRKVGYILILTPQPVLPELVAPSITDDKVPRFYVTNRFMLLFAVISAIILFSVYSFYNTSEQGLTTTQQAPKSLRETNYQGIEEHPAISNDGNYLAFRWVRESSKGQLYIKDLVNEDAPLRMLTQSNDEESSPAWSQDDSSIAYVRKVGEQCQVRVRNLVSNLDVLVDTGCVYNPMRHSLNWSPDGRYLLYPKANGTEMAIFRYDIKRETITQVSFPQGNERDVMAVFGGDSKAIILIREQYVKAKLVLISEHGKERNLLDYDISIVGLAWDHINNEIYTNLLDDAHYAIHKFNLNSNAWQVMRKISTPSNLSYSASRAQLFYSRYSAREHITQVGINHDKEVSKVSSSSRDIYGSYSKENEGIVFLSNRDDNWDIWLKSKKTSTNLTKGKGVALIPSVSPNGKKYVVNIKLPSHENFSLFLGELASGKLTELALGDIEPQNPAWSQDGNFVLFTADNDGVFASYQYQVETGNLSIISRQNEKKIVHGKDGMYYMSRELVAGVWRFNPQENKYKRIISELNENDYGAFFWQGDSLYYLTRTDSEDLIKKYSGTGADVVVKRFPANSIKKYYGISAADDNSFLISMVSLNDADIHTLTFTD